jgi:hypothetical protein
MVAIDEDMREDWEVGREVDMEVIGRWITGMGKRFGNVFEVYLEEHCLEMHEYTDPCRFARRSHRLANCIVIQ